MITTDRLREVLSYDPLTGVFTWIKPTSRRVKVGDVAGVSSGGYVLIGIDGEQYGAHRLAVLYMTGVMPEGKTDHRNGTPSDNRFRNLRPGTHQENIQNRRRPNKNNKTGFLGVSVCKKTGKYKAFLCVDSKSISLGRYGTAEAAHQAYLDAKRLHHGGNTL